MELEKLKTLRKLLEELQEERLNHYRTHGYADIDEWDDEEIIELDDGDCLLQGIDIVYGVVADKIEHGGK